MNGAENTFEEIMATKSTNSVKKTCFETHIYLRSLVNSKLDKFNINTHTHAHTHTHTHTHASSWRKRDTLHKGEQ